MFKGIEHRVKIVTNIQINKDDCNINYSSLMVRSVLIRSI